MADHKIIDAQAADRLAVAPPPPSKDGKEETASENVVRTAHDASDDTRLAADPSHEDAKLDVALDESFPSSDAPSTTQPGKGVDPAPSSGFDPEEEAARMAGKE